MNIYKLLNIKRKSLAGIFLALIIAGFTYYSQQTLKSEVLPSSTVRSDLSKVVSVIDGDTIALENGDRLRFIGIDAPELNHEGLNIKKECYGDESTEFLKSLIENRSIKMEKDVNNTDRYNRLLRYVYVDKDSKEIFVNEEIVKQGFAKSSAYMPDVKFQHILDEAQKYAKENKLGLWGACNGKK